MIKIFKQYAKKDGDSSDISFQKMLIAIVNFVMCWLSIIWGFIYLEILPPGLHHDAIVTIAFVYLLLLSSATIIGHYTKNHLIGVHAFLILTVGLPFSIQLIVGNIANSGSVILWCFAGALGSLIFLTLRHAIIWMVIFVAIVIYTVNFDPAYYGSVLEVPDHVMKIQYNMNILASYIVIFFTSAWFVKTMMFERGRSEELLLNILPSDVAEELKANGKVEPVSHEHATVLFTDFKGFTEISEKISPPELVAEINHCFGVFDEITGRHHIEKIKTIGDSYMAVGGDFGAEKCTPFHVVSAAVEMRNYIKQRKLKREAAGKFGFEMRIGVHSGPVISGVVGVKKFQFDIWGDTVNIASRMETHAEIERVNISEDTYQEVKDFFECEKRESIPVKGKGSMSMYYVLDFK